MGWTADRLRRCELGSNAVEFAILAPVFLLVLLGIVWCGFVFGIAHSTQQLAMDGVRYSLAGLDRTERLALAQSFVEARQASYMLLANREIAVSVIETGGEMRMTLSTDLSDLPIWFALTQPLLPDRAIRRDAATWVGPST